MRRILLLTALILPALAHAECGVVRADGGLNIVVGSAQGNCLSGAAFRQDFLARLNQALAEEEAAREARLRALTTRSGPPVVPGRATVGGRYFGQRP